MAHFAKIENGVVVDLIVIADSDCGGGTFPESESAGQSFIAALSEGDSRLSGTWLQTSYNTRNGVHVNEFGEPDGGKSFRGNFGNIGYIYDSSSDSFINSEDN